MATRRIIILVDDLDGSEANETVTFTLDGTSYEIDLNKDHSEELRAVLRPYSEAGRRVPSSRSWGSAGSAREGIGSSMKQVRAWAREQGLDISARGRIPADVLASYRAAQ